jgi:hypothetical protein
MSAILSQRPRHLSPIQSSHVGIHKVKRPVSKLVHHYQGIDSDAMTVFTSRWSSQEDSAAEYVPHFLVVFMLTPYRKKLEAAHQVWINSMPDMMSQRDTTRLQEMQRHHVLEERDKLLCIVHDLELKLGITEHWQRGSAKWSVTKKMVANRTYQRYLDRLEGLVVVRMFELTKMNQSKTGMFIHSNTTISDMFARLQALEAHCKGPSDTITSYLHRY